MAIGLLDSATACPRSSAFGVDASPTLPEKATALLDSVVGNPLWSTATSVSAGCPVSESAALLASWTKAR
jgi:hypothetical protein